MHQLKRATPGDPNRGEKEFCKEESHPKSEGNGVRGREGKTGETGAILYSRCGRGAFRTKLGDKKKR